LQALGAMQHGTGNDNHYHLVALCNATVMVQCNMTIIRQQVPMHCTYPF
jgi:hypothetical protein